MSRASHAAVSAKVSREYRTPPVVAPPQVRPYQQSQRFHRELVWFRLVNDVESIIKNTILQGFQSKDRMMEALDGGSASERGVH